MKMRIFISYCENDGEGLEYARRAKKLCKKRDIEAWVWKDDARSTEFLTTDVSNNIGSSNAMFTIVTAGTGISKPQKREWSLADSFGVLNCSITREGLTIPDELRSRYSPEFNDSNFDEICDKVITDIVEYMKFGGRVVAGGTDTKKYQLCYIAEQLEKHQEGLNINTIDEFHKNVWEGYQSSTMIRDIVRLAESNEADKENLVHIAIRSNIGLNEFNAKDYWWGPAFKQLGAEIAAGEKRFLVKSILEKVKEIDQSCNEKDDELSIILKEIERSSGVGHVPDVILAPPSMLKSFIHFFEGEKGKVDFTREHGSAATLEVKGIIKLGIYLLGGGILSENVIITNRSNIIWKFVPNPDTGYALTMGIGRGPYPDKVAFIIGTTVRCVIAEREGITRIPIER